MDAFSRILAVDADEHAQRLANWNQSYEQLGPGRFQGRLEQVIVDGIQLFREKANVAVRQSGSPWCGARAFGIPLVTETGARYCGHPLGRDALMTVREGEEYDLLAPAGLEVVGVAIDSALLSSYTRTVDGADIEPQLAGRRLLPVGATRMEELREFFADAFDTLANDPQVLSSDASRRTLRDGVLGRLVGALDERSDEPELPAAYAARRRVVDRARQLTLDCSDAPLTIAELCVRVGVSRRTLQYCFAEVLDINPVRYLRTARLARVRKRLREATPGATVQQEAARYGFWHLSRFAADYRRMFVELPSETLRRARR